MTGLSVPEFALHNDAPVTPSTAILSYNICVGCRSTMESLGAYRFAGAFRYLGSASAGALFVLMQK
jgi:hypothetical protein